jgi:hypothetical protein
MPALFSTPKAAAPVASPTVTAAATEAAKPAVMPVQDDESVNAAKRQKQAAIAAQSGRASTIYSQNSQQSDSFGG